MGDITVRYEVLVHCHDELFKAQETTRRYTDILLNQDAVFLDTQFDRFQAAWDFGLPLMFSSQMSMNAS